MDAYNQLDPQIKSGIEDFASRLQEVFKDDLIAAYVIGSAVEARVRVTSDVNLVCILEAFSEEKAEALREAYRVAKATVNLSAMFLLRDEIAEVVEAFPVKFVDIKMRHHLLCGRDVLAEAPIPKEKLSNAVKQTILNTRLRLRERFILVSLRREQMVRIVAEHASSLRAGAFSILYLEGNAAPTPREALKQICSESKDALCSDLLDKLSRIREKGAFDEIDPDEVVFGLMKLTDLLSERLDKAEKGS